MVASSITADSSSKTGFLHLQACRMRDEKSFEEFGTGLLFYVPDERLSFYCISGKIWNHDSFHLRASQETDPSFTLSSYGDEVTDHTIPRELVEKIKVVAERLLEHRKKYPRTSFSFIERRREFNIDILKIRKENIKLVAKALITNDFTILDYQIKPLDPETISYDKIGCEVIGYEVISYVENVLKLNSQHDLEEVILKRVDDEVMGKSG